MNRKTMIKRVVSIMLASIMVVSLLTGCGGGKASGGNSESNKVIEDLAKKYADLTDVKEVTEGVTLTIAVPSNVRVLDWETNELTVRIEETLGVKLEFMDLPSADYASKLNVMIMGGEELPDIIFNPTGYTTWIEEDVIYDLSPFYKNEKLSPNITAAVKRSGRDLIKDITRPEGGIYILPQFHEEVFTSVSQKLWVYQPWLDKLGLPVPQTMDEFYNACKKVVEGDMNGNGKKDEIGLTGSGVNAGWFDCLMSSFTYAHDPNWRTLKDGKIDFIYTTDAWKEGIKYIKKFFDEGLIPKETLSQTNAQYTSSLNATTPTVFAFSGYNYTGTDLNRRAEYTAIPALTGPNGVRYSCNIPVKSGAGAVITTDCENPLAAFLVCDYMCSQEISITQRYGAQGKDWDFVNDMEGYNLSEFVPTAEGYELRFFPYDMINFWSSSAPQNSTYRQVGPFILDMALCAGAGVWKGAADKTQKFLAELELQTAAAALACYKDQPKEIIDYASLTVEETDEYADVLSAINNYVQEITCSFLVGDKDIDKEWSAYLDELDVIGLSDYADVLQGAYDRAH